jgi:hypothetical protein
MTSLTGTISTKTYRLAMKPNHMPSYRQQIRSANLSSFLYRPAAMRYNILIRSHGGRTA